MYFTTSNNYSSNTTHVILDSLYSVGGIAFDAFNSTISKIQEVLTSPIGQGVLGFGLGLGLHKIYSPLTEKAIRFLGESRIISLNSIGSDPFSNIDLGNKILMTPFICVIGPILEEKIFRGSLQDTLKDKLSSFYKNIGFSDSNGNIAARITSVFFSSVIFGLMHFTNAIVFGCNPVLFLPQVIASTMMGLLFGLAKEFTGELYMPIGMHIGNNTLAWAQYIMESL